MKETPEADSTDEQYIPPIFWCPKSWTFQLLEGYIMIFSMNMFSPPGTQTLVLFVLMGGFLIYLTVQG